jgi:hypothetical protein
MEEIGATIAAVMRGLQERRGAQAGPWECLKKALTTKEQRHIKFKYFRGGALGISVDSSPWLYSLSLKKAAFLSRLRGAGHAVKDIRFYVGGVK